MHRPRSPRRCVHGGIGLNVRILARNTARGTVKATYLLCRVRTSPARSPDILENLCLETTFRDLTSEKSHRPHRSRIRRSGGGGARPP